MIRLSLWSLVCLSCNIHERVEGRCSICFYHSWLGFKWTLIFVLPFMIGWRHKKHKTINLWWDWRQILVFVLTIWKKVEGWSCSLMLHSWSSCFFLFSPLVIRLKGDSWSGCGKMLMFVFTVHSLVQGRSLSLFSPFMSRLKVNIGHW